jgi:hypothetical protein
LLQLGLLLVLGAWLAIAVRLFRRRQEEERAGFTALMNASWLRGSAPWAATVLVGVACTAPLLASVGGSRAWPQHTRTDAILVAASNTLFESDSRAWIAVADVEGERVRILLRELAAGGSVPRVSYELRRDVEGDVLFEATATIRGSRTIEIEWPTDLDQGQVWITKLDGGSPVLIDVAGSAAVQPAPEAAWLALFGRIAAMTSIAAGTALLCSRFLGGAFAWGLATVLVSVLAETWPAPGHGVFQALGELRSGLAPRGFGALGMAESLVGGAALAWISELRSTRRRS